MMDHILINKNHMELFLFSQIDILEISINLIVGVYEVLGKYLISFEEHSIYKRYYYLINLNFNLKFLN